MADSYYLRDVDAKEAEILAAVPDAKLSRWDYGFKLVAERDGNGFIVMQPDREESGQIFINRSTADAIRFLRGEAV